MSLRKCVGNIRKALGDQSDDPCFIETRYSAGFRFIGRVEEQHAIGAEAVVEIEKRRGLKIVVEEELFDDSTLGNRDCTASSIAPFETKKRRRRRRR
jgi:DNA-binding winged helix-turn-helix (wHTH) protein